MLSALPENVFEPSLDLFSNNDSGVPTRGSSQFSLQEITDFHTFLSGFLLDGHLESAIAGLHQTRGSQVIPPECLTRYTDTTVFAMCLRRAFENRHLKTIVSERGRFGQTNLRWCQNGDDKQTLASVSYSK